MSRSRGKRSFEKSNSSPCGHVVEDLPLHHVDPGVDRVAEDLAPAGLLQEALDAAVLAGDDDSEVQGVLDPLQGDRDRRAVLLVELDQLGQVHVGERVPGQDQEPVVQQRLGVLDAPGRPQRLLLGHVGERHAQVGPVPEVVPDDARQELHGGHDLGDAVPSSQRQDVLHHGLADDGQHRLGLVAGERAKPGALSPRHDNGLHGRVIIPSGRRGPSGRPASTARRRRSRGRSRPRTGSSRPRGAAPPTGRSWPTRSSECRS